MLNSGSRPEILLTRSRTLSWQQASENELIFVGPPKFNEQLDKLPVTDIAIEPCGIRISNPRAGEPEFLEEKYQVGQQFDGETRALISLTQIVFRSMVFRLQSVSFSAERAL